MFVGSKSYAHPKPSIMTQYQNKNSVTVNFIEWPRILQRTTFNLLKEFSLLIKKYFIQDGLSSSFVNEETYGIFGGTSLKWL